MKIIAHRASDNINKENSQKAAINSLEKPYVDGIEIDVRLTKDNKLILNHDPFYKGKYIKNTKLKILKKLGLTSLDEILKINTNKIIMIEIKENKENKKVAKTLMKNIKKYNRNIYICSFNYNLIKYIKKNYHIKCGLIIGLKINQNHLNDNFDFVSLNYLSNAKSEKETYRWTVNEPSKIKNIKENIITDNPLKIYKFIEKL